MRQGDTFTIASSTGHLIVVLSDPQKYPDQLVVTNLTTDKSYKDRSCLLTPDDHSWIRHSTVVGYRYSKITKLSTVNRQLATNMIIPYPDPASPEMLTKIFAGAALSRTIPLCIRQALQQQNLLPR